MYAMGCAGMYSMERMEWRGLEEARQEAMAGVDGKRIPGSRK